MKPSTLGTGLPALRIEAVRDFAGRSRWIGQPSVCAVLRLRPGFEPEAMLDRMTAEARALGEDLKPGEAEVASVRIAAGVSTLASDLMLRAGIPVLTSPFVEEMADGASRIWLPTVRDAHHATRKLLESLVQLLDAAARLRPTGALAEQARVALDALRAHAPRGDNTLPMLTTAVGMGIPWERVIGNVYRLGQGSQARWLRSSTTDRTPNIAVSLATNKHLAGELLRRLNLPVARRLLVRSEREAIGAAQAIGYPVVVKPADRARGMGVSARLRTAGEVAAAFRLARACSELILLEEHVHGEDHRLHVFEGEVYRVRHRIPGGVTGDGYSNIEKLLENLNADPRRKPAGKGRDLVRIDLDEEALAMLAEAGLSPDSVPAAGRFVRLRRIANVSVGGVSLPVELSAVHPDNLDLAVRAVRALKLDLAAVDLLIPDIRASWMDGGAAICEVNAQPQLGADAPAWLFQRMFPDQGRIPIVAIVGHGLPDWVHAARVTVQRCGVRLGYCDREGTWLNARRMTKALPGAIYQGFESLLSDTQVDAILLQADESLLEHGLPTDRFDALISTKGEWPASDRRLVAVLAQRSLRRLVASDSHGKAAPRTAGQDWEVLPLDRVADEVTAILARRVEQKSPFSHR